MSASNEKEEGLELKGLTGRVVVEERVQARAVDEDALAVEDAEAPRGGAVAGLAGAAGGEVGVVEGGVDGEGLQGVGVGLVVSENGKRAR